MIYTGDNEILGIKLGNTDINAIYAGDLLLYPTTVTGWSVSPTSFEVKRTPGSVNIHITSLSAWTISSSESWITFSQNSGDSGRTTVIATYTENTGDSARTATITVTDGTNTSTVQLEQSIKDNRLVVTYNVTSTSNATRIFYAFQSELLSKIELENGTEIPTNTTSYTFSAVGEQKLYCTLSNPTGGLYGLFRDCTSVVGVEIPDGVSALSNYLFTNCQMQILEIPDSVTVLKSYETIAGCGALKTLKLGNSLASLGDLSVRNNSNMEEIIILTTTPPSLGVGVFGGTNNCPIYVPDGSVSSYQAAWSSLSSRIIGISNRI